MTYPLLRLAAATVALLVAQALLAVLVPPSARTVAIGLPLAATSTMLVAGVLLLAAAHARHAGIRLALWLFGLWGSIQANYLIEAVFFDIGLPRADQPWLFAHALASALAAGLIVAAACRWSSHPGPAVSGEATPVPWLTLVRCGATYLVLYIAAGIIIAWPIVQPYYGQRPMPSPTLVFPLQIVRGMAFGATVLLLVRHIGTDRLTSGLIAGLLLSVLGGVAPLLLPNAYLPDVVRLAHLAEVLVSNFAFGWLAAWWLWPKEGQQAR